MLPDGWLGAGSIFQLAPYDLHSKANHNILQRELDHEPGSETQAEEMCGAFDRPTINVTPAQQALGTVAILPETFMVHQLVNVVNG